MKDEQKLCLELCWCGEVNWDPLSGRTYLALCKINVLPASTKKYSYNDDGVAVQYLASWKLTILKSVKFWIPNMSGPEGFR